MYPTLTIYKCSYHLKNDLKRISGFRFGHLSSSKKFLWHRTHASLDAFDTCVDRLLELVWTAPKGCMLSSAPPRAALLVRGAQPPGYLYSGEGASASSTDCPEILFTERGLPFSADPPILWLREEGWEWSSCDFYIRIFFQVM